MFKMFTQFHNFMEVCISCAPQPSTVSHVNLQQLLAQKVHPLWIIDFTGRVPPYCLPAWDQARECPPFCRECNSISPKIFVLWTPCSSCRNVILTFCFNRPAMLWHMPLMLYRLLILMPIQWLRQEQQTLER
jgi:hypothetical protein